MTIVSGLLKAARANAFQIAAELSIPLRNRVGERGTLVIIGILFWREIKEKLKLTIKFVKANMPLPKVRIFT